MSTGGLEQAYVSPCTIYLLDSAWSYGESAELTEQVEYRLENHKPRVNPTYLSDLIDHPVHYLSNHFQLPAI